MRPAILRLLAVLPLPALLGAAALPRSQDDPAAAADLFAKEIRPSVVAYCEPCHGAASASAGIRFDKYPDLASVEKDTTTWRKAAQAIRERTMPPQGARRPSATVATRLSDQLGMLLDRADERAAPRDPGRVVPRRLNRLEYNNTIRDLFGVDTRPADRFPADGGGGGGFDNNADTLFLPPVLMEKYLETAGEVLEAADPKRLFFVAPSKTVPARVAAKRIVTFFASRAYRRPVRLDELARLMRLYDASRAGKESHAASVKLALKAVLVSPNFLFRSENDPGNGGAAPLDSYEIASRLSYFLWSSMPDDTLFTLARQKKLSDPNIVAGQVERMLNSPKAQAFSESFAGQWLRAREVLTTAQPDPGRFPTFTPTLRRAMVDETCDFFLSVLRENSRVSTFIDADYTFLNEELAKHYGIAGVSGPEMRRVQVSGGVRGGVLTQGAILTLTSYPQRTSPVLRGKWVLSEMLGAPPPPPPPVVATLPPDDQPKEGQTLRQRLEKHRDKPECKGCHQRIDPLGFGLENFDAIGRWRTEIGGVKVDTVGELLTGEKFDGVLEMKKVLLAREPEIARNLAERMLAYALGRGLEPADLPSVRKIVDACRKDGFRTRTLVTEVVKSLPFRYRQGEKAKTAHAANKTAAR